MKKHYDEKFKRMIAEKYQSGTKVLELVKDYNISKAAVYLWRDQYGNSVSIDEEKIDYEKEYKKLLAKHNETQCEMEALKKCIAIFSKK